MSLFSKMYSRITSLVSFCFTSEIDKWPRYKMYVTLDIQIPIKIFQSNYSIIYSL